MANESTEREVEFQSKKLMTIAKSKYYMLKVNYPQLAEAIDNEPLYNEQQEASENLSNKQQDVNEKVRVKPLAE